MVDEGTVFCFTGEAGKVCCHDDAGAVGGDGEGQGAGDCAAGQVVEVGGGESGAEGKAGGVLLDAGVTKEALAVGLVEGMGRGRGGCSHTVKPGLAGPS